MEELTKEYLLLFNTITRAEKTLEDLRMRLMDAQRTAEDLYIERKEA